MILKRGDKGDKVKQLQRILGISDDGSFGPLLEAAVKNWQTKNGLKATGSISDDEFEMLFELDITTDAIENSYTIPTADEDIIVSRYYLPTKEYKNENVKKKSICIHHTAGWNDPYKQVDQWARDNRGQIGTAYIIGGPNPSTWDNSFDGVVLQVFNDEKWAWHLGVSDKNPKLDKETIGIELCNFGYLEKVGADFYTYSKQKILRQAVCELDEPFRGKRYWHKYSDTQIFNLKYLLLYLSEVHKIDIRTGLLQWLDQGNTAFEFKKDALQGKVGLYSHTNVRTDKWDVFPQPELVNMLNELKK